MIKWLFISLIICNSCNHNSSIISQKKMQEILWDIMRADALAQQLATKDSSIILTVESKRLSGQVFLIHNITEEQFKKSYTYYSDHLDEMEIILDSISAQQVRKNIPAFINNKNLILDSSKQILDSSKKNLDSSKKIFKNE